MEKIQARLVLCTAPSLDVARSLGRALVEAGLAACVTLVPAVVLIYRWQGEVQEESEVQLLCKTRSELLPELKAWLQQHHPYETPELIAMTPCDGSRAYFDWIEEATRGGVGGSS